MGRSAFGIVKRDNKILLGKKILNVESPLAGQWVFCGGGVKQEETIYEGFIREMEEETGYIVRPTTLLAFGIDNKGTELYYYKAKIIGGTQRAGDDISDLLWEPKPTVLDKCSVTQKFWPPQLIQYLRTTHDQHKYIRDRKLAHTWYQQTSD